MRATQKFGWIRSNRGPGIMGALDALRCTFGAQKRMKISGNYRACYEVGLVHQT